MPDPAYPLQRLHVVTRGPDDGSPVLVLHGWGSNAQLMQPLADALAAEDFRTLNVDLPGHGRSPAPPEPWGLEEHAALVDALLEERVGDEPVALLGHSNGGRIGLYMAGDERYTDRFDQLVLVSPSGVRRPRTWRYHVRSNTAKALKAPFEVLPEGSWLREEGLDWLRHSLVWSWLGSSDYQQLSGVMRGTFVQTVNTYVEDRLPRIKVPVLLLWGTADEAVVRGQMEAMERAIPDAGLVELEDAGHYGWLDAFDTVVASALHLLREAEPATL